MVTRRVTIFFGALLMSGAGVAAGKGPKRVAPVAKVAGATAVGATQAPPRRTWQPIDRVVDGLALGAASFTTINQVQKKGWIFHARPGERVVFRRGVRFALTAGHAVPSDKNEPVQRYRLSFLNGRLAGIRVRYRKDDRSRYRRVRTKHGEPTWELSDRAEWVDPDLTSSLTVWKDGSRTELVDLRLSRRSRFMTRGEINQEVARRKQRAASFRPRPAPAPPPAPAPAPPKPNTPEKTPK